MTVRSAAEPSEAGPRDDIVLSVVVPVYNQAGSIVENVAIIRQRLEANVSGEVEIIVVSDGSIDRTQQRLLESGVSGLRVLHYDRNLGKGYAAKSECWKRAVDGLGISTQISTSIQLASVTISG